MTDTVRYVVPDVHKEKIAIGVVQISRQEEERTEERTGRVELAPRSGISPCPPSLRCSASLARGPARIQFVNVSLAEPEPIQRRTCGNRRTCGLPV